MRGRATPLLRGCRAGFRGLCQAEGSFQVTSLLAASRGRLFAERPQPRNSTEDHGSQGLLSILVAFSGHFCQLVLVTLIVHLSRRGSGAGSPRCLHLSRWGLFSFGSLTKACRYSSARRILCGQALESAAVEARLVLGCRPRLR
jgi:hypothetical protein